MIITGPDVHPEFIGTKAQVDPVASNLPSSVSAARSPSPLVSTPGSISSTQTANKK